jgi:hypothetical protein
MSAIAVSRLRAPADCPDASLANERCVCVYIFQPGRGTLTKRMFDCYGWLKGGRPVSAEVATAVFCQDASAHGTADQA